MIGAPEFNAFLIMALIYAVWSLEQLSAIRKKLKALREKMGK
jgi:hypothetical protein